VNIDLIERQGRLTYKVGDTERVMEGNFRLSIDGRVIEGRKLRGRNRWQVCSTENAVAFVERREWEK
jgi:hypothetical protein